MQNSLEHTLMVEIDAVALRRLMAEGRLVATDFRCAQAEDKLQIKRWCLENASLQLRRY